MPSRLDSLAVNRYASITLILMWESGDNASTSEPRMPRSKRYQEVKKAIDPKKAYSASDAIELLKKSAQTKFNATVEVHLNLGVDVKKGDQQVRATVIFPYSTGNVKKVMAFVSADRAKDATEAGADIVGAEELIEQIAKTNKVSCDIAVATPDMMPKLAKIAKILGPAGLMPNPKTDTVGANIKKIIEEIKKGKVAFKNDATANLHQAIGKISADSQELIANFTTFIEAVKKVKPSSSKGTFIKSATIKTTMSPGVHIDLSTLA